MEYNRRVLKVVSIVQIVMSAIFLALGIVDRYEVRFIYSSFLFMPCWIAALILPAGIMGLILVNKASPSSTLVNTLSSVSMTCAIVSGITVYHYKWAVSRILVANLFFTITNWRGTHFVSNDEPLKLSDQENTAVAITSLIVIFSIIEIALAVCGAWSSDSSYQSPRENQVSRAGYVHNQFGAGQIPLQPTYIVAQPMVAIPVSNYNVHQ